MPVSTSTSDRGRIAARHVVLLATLCALSLARPARAADPLGSPTVPPVTSGGAGAAGQPEEDDYQSTPYTDYGSFNEEEEEDADTKFLQYGRLFGISVGSGLELLDGNRGRLWQGGFPMVDLRLHYWFDFHFALDLGFYTAAHYFQGVGVTAGRNDATILFVGVHFKYYFDTRDLSAPISFANPYLILGGGNYTKTQTNSTQGASADSQNGLGLNAGAGLEFALKPRSIYFSVEGLMHFVTFQDTSSQDYNVAPYNIPDLSGHLYTITGSLLFTW